MNLTTVNKDRKRLPLSLAPFFSRRVLLRESARLKFRLIPCVTLAATLLLTFFWSDSFFGNNFFTLLKSSFFGLPFLLSGFRPAFFLTQPLMGEESVETLFWEAAAGKAGRCVGFLGWNCKELARDETRRRMDSWAVMTTC